MEGHDDDPPVWEFHPKHRWSVKNHILSGICVGSWIRMCWRFRAEIDWRRYWHRMLFLTFMSLFNSFLALFDTVFYRRAIAEQSLNPRPVFILGHPRTGTTHLHNLLSLDRDQFTFSNTFHVGFPSSFLCHEKWGSKILAPILDDRRPMDNMKLNFQIPQEDELAHNVLSSGRSPYMPLVFPREEKTFRPYFTFDEDVCPPAEYQEWLDSFLYFFKKLTLKTKLERGEEAAKNLRMLIKSPVHTSRVKLLLTLFPEAQFIYIHRHPYQVFQSATHMADAYYWYCHLQEANDKCMTEFIFHQYELMYRRYVEERTLIPDGQLYELSFHDLDQQPVEEIEKIYNHLGWDDFERLRPRVEAYTQSLRDFKKNDHRQLPDEWKSVVYSRWRASFDEFGYSP